MENKFCTKSDVKCPEIPEKTHMVMRLKSEKRVNQSMAFARFRHIDKHPIFFKHTQAQRANFKNGF